MKIFSTVALLFAVVFSLHAQEVLKTGGRIMPHKWIDKDTNHRIIKLTSNCEWSFVSRRDNCSVEKI